MQFAVLVKPSKMSCSTLIMFLPSTNILNLLLIEHSRKTTPTTGEAEQKKTIATIPYIKGTSERIARILRPFNISVAHKPTVTLRNTLTKVKDPTDTKTRIGTVYKVTCTECPATYIGETGRTLVVALKNISDQQRNKTWRIELWFIIWKQTIELIGREPLVWSLIVLR
jgi:hypothetical protein